ncbi:hypothetical protein C8Q80DRAFT_1091076 [Daedaleopsis nitida]|nr:hypothetical protein C8Q80DRAFT_1091076 [Daedaleopsis nitida]
MGRYCQLCRSSFPTARSFFTHRRWFHAHPKPPSPKSTFRRHPHLNARPCNRNGQFLPPNTPAPDQVDDIDWTPFPDRPSFEFVELTFENAGLSRDTLKQMFRILAAKHIADGHPEYMPIYKKYQEILDVIDAIPYGEAPWRTFAIRWRGQVTPNSPAWKREVFLVHTRDTLRVAEIMAASPDFDGNFDYVPYEEFSGPNCRQVSDLMSGRWAYKQAISEDPATHGSMLVPIILGADKTTVSVATGNQEFHPVYMSLGNFHNEVRRAHRDSVIPIAFLAIPTAAHEWEKDDEFRVFKKQLYHASLVKILEPLHPAMTTPHVLRCPDGHFRRAIFELGPFIADYPEQVYLSGIVSGWCPKCFAIPTGHFTADDPRTREAHERVKAACNAASRWDVSGINAEVKPFTSYFPRADIHELLSPDLLHQLIKGCFKDHLVSWVIAYIKQTAPSDRDASRIIDDIDRRLAAVPPFAGLRRFPQGRNFKQWTGDDSKALMKVFLPAITGHVPEKMVKCLAAFLDFCYLARHNSHDSHSLAAMKDLLTQFEQLRTIFEEVGVRVDEGFALPRQHALFHYVRGIQLFGSPNGLCTSITESKHIPAVKKPWRESNRRNPLGQIIMKITRRNKLAAARAEFGRRNMLHGNVLSYVRRVMRRQAPHRSGSDSSSSEDSDSSEFISRVAEDLGEPRLVEHLRRYLHRQYNPDDPDPDALPIHLCPYVWSGSSIAVYRTASSTFYAPSELCGPGGMHREMIRATPRWWGAYARYDTVLVNIDPDRLGLDGMLVARIRAFLSYLHEGDLQQCALVEWFASEGDMPDTVSGMWVVCPELYDDGERVVDVIPISSIVRACHLVPVYGTTRVPPDFHFADSLDAFRRYYINWYVDYHAHETLF